MTKPIRKRSKGEHGQSIVELALTLPLLIMLLLGLIEFGHGMNSYLTVLASSRDAARMGATIGATNETTMRNLVATETTRLSPSIPTATENCGSGAGVCITNDTYSTTDKWLNVKVCHTHNLIVGVPWPSMDSFLMCSFTRIRLVS